MTGPRRIMLCDLASGVLVPTNVRVDRVEGSVALVAVGGRVVRMSVERLVEGERLAQRADWQDRVARARAERDAEEARSARGQSGRLL